MVACQNKLLTLLATTCWSAGSFLSSCHPFSHNHPAYFTAKLCWGGFFSISGVLRQLNFVLSLSPFFFIIKPHNLSSRGFYQSHVRKWGKLQRGRAGKILWLRIPGGARLLHGTPSLFPTPSRPRDCLAGGFQTETSKDPQRNHVSPSLHRGVGQTVRF